MSGLHPKPPFPYRLNIQHNEFDELLLGTAVHIEMLGDRQIWMCVHLPGTKDTFTFNIKVDRKGRPVVVTLDDYPDREKSQWRVKDA